MGAAGSDFLRDLRQILQPGDSLLLGIDMLKPEKTLISAYDDPIGVTAAFNLNLLARINRELGADFNLQQFAHVALFNEATHSVEMHLRSRSRQKATIPEASISVQFEKDETIWTKVPTNIRMTNSSASHTTPASTAKRSDGSIVGFR